MRRALYTVMVAASLVSPAAEAGDAVPIHGSFRGTFRSETSPVLGPTLVHMEAGGTLSHFGHARAVTSSPDVSVDLLRLVLVMGRSSWSGVITAANGDELHGRYTYRTREVPFSPITGPGAASVGSGAGKGFTVNPV